MNSTVARPTIPKPQIDVARPMPRPAPPRPVVAAPATAAPTAGPATLTTNLVSNIPLHAPATPQPAVNEDEELDKIMQDVGHELKQADRKNTKKHFSLLGHKKAKPTPGAMAPPKIRDIAPAPQPVQAALVALAAPAPAPAKPKPPKANHAPTGVIFVTILITGALIAAAFYSYR